jgi:hypothetical protein
MQQQILRDSQIQTMMGVGSSLMSGVGKPGMQGFQNVGPAMSPFFQGRAQAREVPLQFARSRYDLTVDEENRGYAASRDRRAGDAETRAQESHERAGETHDERMAALQRNQEEYEYGVGRRPVDEKKDELQIEASEQLQRLRDLQEGRAAESFQGEMEALELRIEASKAALSGAGQSRSSSPSSFDFSDLHGSMRKRATDILEENNSRQFVQDDAGNFVANPGMEFGEAFKQAQNEFEVAATAEILDIVNSASPEDAEAMVKDMEKAKSLGISMVSVLRAIKVQLGIK